jgi:two-component system NarL family response regulator
MEAIQVLICDDHPLFRQGLRAALEAEAGIGVAGEAESAEDAVAKAQDLLPDVVLMDLKMEKAGGVAATTQIKESIPTAKVLILTASEDEADLYDSIRAGATGYLVKGVSADEVAAGIKAVFNGETLISPTMISKLFSEFSELARKAEAPAAGPPLTKRETEVLKLVTKGHSNREIANLMQLSEHTAKKHVANILEKLQFHNRMEAALYAIREKLVDPG